MRGDETVDEDHPILPWRMAAGVFLHLLLPYYLVAEIADVLLTRPPLPNAEAVLHRALHVSPVLLGGYAMVAMLTVIAAALLDAPLRARRSRRLALDPRYSALQLQALIQRNLEEARGRYGSSGDAALERLRRTRWDFSDPLQQALARDLAEVVRTSTAALDSAAAERKKAVIERATATFERLADAQAEFAEARGLQDERQAQVISGYVELRYGPSDFSGSPN